MRPVRLSLFREQHQRLATTFITLPLVHRAPVHSIRTSITHRSKSPTEEFKSRLRLTFATASFQASKPHLPHTHIVTMSNNVQDPSANEAVQSGDNAMDVTEQSQKGKGKATEDTMAMSEDDDESAEEVSA